MTDTADSLQTASTCLLEVPAEGLDEYYDIVVAGMQKVIDKGEGVGWTPYTVYHELKLQSSTLYMGFEDNEYVGFVVLTEGQEATGGSYWYIWIAYSVHNDGIKKFLPQLEDMAISAGHAKIKFGTTRLGWYKIAPKFGFKIEEVRFVKTL